ncbi:predicted protein, partial [Nematostella vectensis]
GATPHLNSDLFWTGRYCYKLKLCLALNGDGIATNEFILVYIFISKGKFDALLR